MKNIPDDLTFEITSVIPKKLNRMIVQCFKGLLFSLMLGVLSVTALSCISLRKVNPIARNYYNELKDELVAQGYQTNLTVISSKRPEWFNNILTKFGAAKRSQHLEGNAIDVLVRDVNADGKKDGKDVDIVYNILNDKIIKNKGGIGTYKNERGIWNRQMVHFDCRGYRARWHR